MRRKVILLILMLMLLLTACTEKKTETTTASLTENTIINLDDFSFQLLDYFLIKSESNPVQDSMNVYQKISDFEVRVDSGRLGFDIGFNHSNSEVSKRDGYLVLILKYNPDGNIAAQRDSIIPKMNILSKDNKGEDLLLVHNSMEDNYIQIENPIGVLIFKTFTDIETAEIWFDGKPYNLEIK